jgi:putative aldouronate transport system substrate-binding protein
MSVAERYIEEGTFRDLTPYMEKWSPAYWKWIHSNPDYDRAMKTDSRKYYGYGLFQEAGGWNATYLGPVVNKTWLDECGLPMPKTISDWDRTIRAFKQRYGAVLSFAWSRAAVEGTFISGAWGAHSFADYRLYVDKNQKVQIANIQPEYRDQLAYFAQWWKDGLIDQDFLSINDTMARTNAMNKKMGITVTSMGQLTNWINDAKNYNTGAESVGLQYPTGDDGTLVQVSPGGLGIGNVVAVVSTSCPDDKLELVMRMLDYAYTEEGFLFWNFGKQGISWDYNAEGKPAYLPLVTNDPEGMNNAVDKYAGTIWNGSCIQATAMLYMKNSPQGIAANDLWFYPNEKITWPNKLPPGMTFTAEESTRAGELVGAISTYVNEMAIQFITGRANLGTWNNYVARVNSIGASELLGIFQAALDRYYAR